MSKLLLVEDEAAISESLAYALRRDGFQVVAAGTLAEARRALPGVDLVVLDLMLPDGSGFDLLHAMRASQPGGRSGSPAVIILSSRDDESDRVAALETGADDYVTKPFSPREVVARVRAVLRRASQEAAPRERPSRPAPFEIDRPTRRASASGRPLELTKVEFDLLACLLEAPGRVFSRAEIIDRVWGDGFAISDRTIDSHMKALRRKVGEAGGDPTWLETVRGVGYRVSDGSALGEPAR